LQGKVLQQREHPGQRSGRYYYSPLREAVYNLSSVRFRERESEGPRFQCPLSRFPRLSPDSILPEAVSPDKRGCTGFHGERGTDVFWHGVSDALATYGSKLLLQGSVFPPRVW